MNDKKSNVDEVAEGLGSLDISQKDEKRQRTPEQPREGGTRDAVRARKKINFETDASSTNENDEGRWLENHPWSGKTPDPENLKMDTTISASKEYPLASEWSETGEKVDLQKIYSNLPKFITEMKGPTSREELKHLLDSILYQMNLTEANIPHIREIVDKKRGDEPTDKPSLRRQPSKSGAKFKAFSLPNRATPLTPSEKDYLYLDCEYMLKMWLPQHSKGWFTGCEEGNRRIREINNNKKNSRWIFTPSYRRAKIALLDWPEDKIVTPDSTIRILVVRPSEFDDYVKYCGHKFPVISLPQDEIGAGYPRFWIQKIALRLELAFIWMIDDSVECFYEYHPTVKPPKREGSSSSQSSYSIRRRQFGKVFERIEKLVKDSTIAAMSPKRFRGGTPLENPFVCLPPRIAVFLNLETLKLKGVFYRPELQTYEDMIFGYECEQNGLKVYIDNRVHLRDHPWKNTGARSRYVQRNPTTAAARP